MAAQQHSSSVSLYITEGLQRFTINFLTEHLSVLEELVEQLKQVKQQEVLKLRQQLDEQLCEKRKFECGISYKLQLADGRAVWARSNVVTLLMSLWKVDDEKTSRCNVHRIHLSITGRWKLNFHSSKEREQLLSS